jgi:protein-S-isoprenylcysteine O-methyltransferase Ste14
VIPWALSLVGPRFAGAWNALGVIPLGLGAALLVWVAVTGLRSARDLSEQVSLDWQPKVFVSSGPYAWTRNPMYVGELLLWAGWAVWLGSPVTLLGGALLWPAMTRLIAREERDLEARFGDEFRRYAARVPRWLALRRSVSQ